MQCSISAFPLATALSSLLLLICLLLVGMSCVKTVHHKLERERGATVTKVTGENATGENVLGWRGK